MPIIQTSDPDIQAMRGIHVYHFFMSNCAQRVNLTLAEKGLDWTPHSINLLSKENTKPEYMRINPKGLVPAMVHNGVVITESIDILRYIEEQFPEPALYSSDPSQRQQIDRWMDAATENHNSVVKTYMYAIAFGGDKSPDEMKRYLEQQKDPGLKAFHQQATVGFSQDQIAEAERALFTFYDQLENELSLHRWVVGDNYSYADIAWFVQYFLMQRTGVVNFANYPNIRRWGRMFMQRPSFERGIKNLQPWYAALLCKILTLKAFKRRGGRLAPKGPRRPVLV